MFKKALLLTTLVIIPLFSYGDVFSQWSTSSSGREFINHPTNGENVMLVLHKPLPGIILPRIIFTGGRHCQSSTRGYYYGMGGLFINGTKKTVELWCEDGHDIYTPANNQTIRSLISVINSESEIRIKFSGEEEYIFDTTGGSSVLNELQSKF